MPISRFNERFGPGVGAGGRDPEERERFGPGGGGVAPAPAPEVAPVVAPAPVGGETRSNGKEAGPAINPGVPPTAAPPELAQTGVPGLGLNEGGGGVQGSFMAPGSSSFNAIFGSPFGGMFRQGTPGQGGIAGGQDVGGSVTPNLGGEEEELEPGSREFQEMLQAFIGRGR